MKSIQAQVPPSHPASIIRREISMWHSLYMSIKGKASPSKINPGKVTSYLFAKNKEMQEIWLNSQGVMTSGSQCLTLHSFSKLIQGPCNLICWERHIKMLIPRPCTRHVDSVDSVHLGGGARESEFCRYTSCSTYLTY